MMHIRARAPLRISLAGGGTDIIPYFEKNEGAVISTTIDRYAYVTLKPLDENIIRVSSHDYDLQESFKGISDLRYNGRLDLVKAGFRKIGLGKRGFEITIHADAPPGSGLGSSSAVAVAFVGALYEFENKVFSSYEIADMAVKIERDELGLEGGVQDQYASTFGGINFIEFKKKSVIVNPLKLRLPILHELLASMVLCDTKKTRLSGDILKRQVDGYKGKKPDILKNLDEIKKLAYEMKDSLVKGNIERLATLLHQSWIHKKGLDKSISNKAIDKLYQTAIKGGALGGKLLGAGGGGHLLFICRPEKKESLVKQLIKRGCNIVKFNFDSEGLQTWRINEKGVIF